MQVCVFVLPKLRDYPDGLKIKNMNIKQVKIKNTTIIILYVLTTTLVSCQTSKNVEGIYSAKKNLNKFEFFSDSTFVYQSTILYGSSFINKYSDGTWRYIDNNSIILNSRIKSNLVPVYIEKSKSDETQVCTNLLITQTKIKNTRWEYTDKDYWVIPYINGKNYLDLHPELSDEPTTIDLKQMIGLDSDKSGKYVMKVSPVKRGNYCLSLDESIGNIYFEIEKQPETLERRTFYRLKTEKVNIPMQPNESFTINIVLNDSLFSYRIFDNEILKINDKKLIFKDSEDNNKTNKLYLKK